MLKIFINVFLILILLLIVWFKIPYSPLKSKFQREMDAMTVNVSGRKEIISGKKKSLTDENCPGETLTDNTLTDKTHSGGTGINVAYTEEEFSHLPMALKQYVKNCGYIGKPKISCFKLEYHDVDFMQSMDGPKLKIDYAQYNFVETPCRMALIESSMFGIPFEGCDYYQNGTGGMKGVLGKVFTLFDQRGEAMDQSGLVTFLAESLFAPDIFLQDYISFEEISDYEVKAVITYKGQTASGIFHFNEQYEMTSFTTNDRAITLSDGRMEYVPWSAVCGDYVTYENGIKYPGRLLAVWNYPDKDFVYFDGTIDAVGTFLLSLE